MKKILIAILAATLCISLIACGEVTEVDFEDRINKDNTSTSSKSPAETGAPQNTKAPADTKAPASPAYNEIDIYNAHLTSGALAEIIDEVSLETGKVLIESYLEDLNEDGIRELLLTVTDNSFTGVRGYAHGTYLFTINNGKAVQLTDAYSGGGSMGGYEIIIVEDEQTGKHHAAYSGYFRDGYYFSESALIPYKISGSKITAIVTLANGRATTDDLGSTYVDMIKAETSVYTIKDGELFYWQVDEDYVSEQKYNQNASRYKRYSYKATGGTVSTPVASGS